MITQKPVTHIALVLDESSSMHGHAHALVKVADGLISHLAKRSKELDQETRISVFTFASTPKCVLWDLDVLRLPSIQDLYHPSGQTALVDAVLLALTDLGMTPEKYGEHSFLVYVLTDGEENNSVSRPAELSRRLAALPDHWTVGAMVPTITAKAEAKMYGFPASNIEVWDTTTVRGVEEAVEKIQQSADTFMVARKTTGTRSTKNLFTMNAAALTADQIQAAGLKPLKPNQFKLIQIPAIPDKTEIKSWVEGEAGLKYRVGAFFYQLTKPEKVQANKEVAVVNKKTAQVYIGHDARTLLNLPDYEVKVGPEANPEYTIFIQSNSVNRHLVSGTKLLEKL